MPQSPLPAERELCLEFGIVRMRARRALNVLEDAGLVYREVTRGTVVYFCDPASPRQCGSNENTNGMLRHYFPTGTDLGVHSANTSVLSPPNTTSDHPKSSDGRPPRSTSLDGPHLRPKHKGSQSPRSSFTESPLSAFCTGSRSRCENGQEEPGETSCRRLYSVRTLPSPYWISSACSQLTGFTRDSTKWWTGLLLQISDLNRIPKLKGSGIHSEKDRCLVVG